MDYMTYFGAIDKLKDFFRKNYSKVDTAYVVYDENLINLELDVILWDKNFKNKLIKFMKENSINANVTYFTLKEFEAQFNKQLNKEYVFNKFANSWHIYGKTITDYYFKYLKEHFQNEIFMHKKWSIAIKDLVYTARNSSGALIYNPKLNKFLLIKHNLPNEEYWALPKGGVEEGELHSDTAKREVFEEVGLKKIKVYDNINFGSFHTVYKFNKFWKAYGFYRPAITFEEQIKISDEHSDYAWLTFEELQNKISYNISKYLAYKLGSWILKKYNKLDI